MASIGPEIGLVHEEPGNSKQNALLLWEKRGVHPLVGLFATMIGALRPTSRAALLAEGAMKPAIAFFAASFPLMTFASFGAVGLLLGLEGELLIYELARGIIASLAAAVGLVGCYTSLADAFGARCHKAFRAALYLAFLTPLFLVDLTPLFAQGMSASLECAERLAGFVSMAPLLLLMVSLESAAKLGARVSPREALLLGVIPVGLAFVVGKLALAVSAV